MLRRLGSLIEFLVGYFALTAFAFIAFAGPPSDMRWRQAFLVGGAIAVIEVAVLLWRTQPASRLVLGANLWLIVGAAAFVAHQWWLLEWYQRNGVASMLAVMAATGAVATCVSVGGFVGAAGQRRRVVQASGVLLTATLLALAVAASRIGDIRATAVTALFCLGWLNRALRRWVVRAP